MSKQPVRLLAKPNLIDRIAEYVNPAWAKERLQSRSVAEQQRSYDAAGHGARTQNMYAPRTSPNTEIYVAGDTIRNRSREMVRNNPWMLNAVNTMANEVVGSGIRPSFHATGRDLEVIKKEWAKFSNKTTCDFHGRKNFYMLQREVMRALAESGEVLVFVRRSKKSNALIQFQIAECDLIDSTKDGYLVGNRGYIQQGIQFSNDGSVQGYWLYDAHPGEYNYLRDMESKFYSKDEVIHIFNQERPGQIRGVPIGHASMMIFKDLDEFRDAEIMKQKTAALTVAFVSDQGLSPNSVCRERVIPENMEPGTIIELGTGDKVDFSQPPQNQNFEQYMAEGLRAAAAGMGMSYESLSGNLQKVNFSSGRMGWIKAGRETARWQSEINTQFNERAWDIFMDALFFIGKISRETDRTSDWTPARREMLDPIKETTGILNQVNGALMSWSEAVRQTGQDPDDVIQEILEDKKRFAKLGITPEDLTVFAKPQEKISPPTNTVK